MFDLVADVERYPEFVPLCQSLKIRQRTPKPDGTEIVIADMTVSFKLVRETFTSRVTLDRPNLKILVEYLQGAVQQPGKPLDVSSRNPKTACDVGFFLSYEFKSRMLAMLMGTMFDTAFQRFAAAFEKRADAIYGKGSAASRPSSECRLFDGPKMARRQCLQPSSEARKNAHLRMTAELVRPRRSSPLHGAAARRAGDAGRNRLMVWRRGFAGVCGPRASSVSMRSASITERCAHRAAADRTEAAFAMQDRGRRARRRRNGRGRPACPASRRRGRQCR